MDFFLEANKIWLYLPVSIFCGINTLNSLFSSFYNIYDSILIVVIIVVFNEEKYYLISRVKEVTILLAVII
jgi:hypothetical protein